MPHEYKQDLAIYLNDHLAGAVAALELLARIVESQRATPFGSVLASLQIDIQADQRTLELLIRRLHIRIHRPRQALAWLSEKIAQLKLRSASGRQDAFRLIESLEILLIGIEGKHALWQTLATLAPDLPTLQSIDYIDLLQRANEQQITVNQIRLDVVMDAFQPSATEQGIALGRRYR